mmetsp:Transcript_2918/g.6892  ORF Transcript_2918/g.6892 Transcript_2918/m.6892 type:complete len:462 (-) Transcript_2918:65-1450(-)
MDIILSFIDTIVTNRYKVLFLYLIASCKTFILRMWLSQQNMNPKILSSIMAGLFVVSASSSETTTTSESFSITTTKSEPSFRGKALEVALEVAKQKGPCAIGAQELYAEHPVLCEFLDRLEANVEDVASEMTEFAREKNLLVGEDFDWEANRQEQTEQQLLAENQMPVVFAHGMGDSCFNSGMIHIGDRTSELLGGVYVTCVPTGDTNSEDTKNGYFLNMDASVDVFAAKIAKDPRLQKGFHAIGFSQGNNVIRGYIARYNTPTVHTFISVNGVNAGEGTVPGCFPSSKGADETKLGSFCDLLLEQASKRAYTEFAQEHSFQANYWRDPRESKQEDYYKYSQLARWNNEGPDKNQTFNDNFAKSSKFVWIMATADSMVWPREGEHWGCPDSKDPFESPILPMNETEWYKEDFFGLRKAQESGKNVFETFQGGHLQFTMEDFDRWVTTYLVSSDTTPLASME